MTTHAASDDTLIRDSQIGRFSSFKERLGVCCCRLFKKSSNYNLSSASKSDEEQEDKKPAYVNQAFQREKQARQEKLDKIAKTLPAETGFQTPNAFKSSNETPTRSTVTTVQGTPRSLTKVTQGTPRSGIGLAQNRPSLSTPQNRPPINTPQSKSGTSTINKASPLAKTNKKDSDETSSGFTFQF
jgi:hypothetical protein